MKTIKQWTAILLGIAILTALFILPAAAADSADASAAEPVFVTNGEQLCGIDFSAVIRDDTTICTGNLTLCGADGKIRRYAQFDEKQTGVAVFGVVDTEGVFKADPLYTGAVDETLCLRPESATDTLYDGVGSFTFAVHDVFADTAEAEISLLRPAIAVTKADGEQVREMTLDFSPGKTNAPLFLDCADLTQTLTFAVTFSNFFDVAAFTLQPTAYDAATGELTVSVRNDKGQEGCTLFDCGITISKDFPLTAYQYRLQVPGGMFCSSRNEKLRSAEITRSIAFMRSIAGMPVRIVTDLSIPSWIVSLEKKLAETFHSEKAAVPVAILLGIPALLLRIPDMIRADFVIQRSLKDYGFRWTSVDWIKILFDWIRRSF